MIDSLISAIFGAIVGATVAVWSVYSYEIFHKQKASDEATESRGEQNERSNLR